MNAQKQIKAEVKRLNDEMESKGLGRVPPKDLERLLYWMTSGTIKMVDGKKQFVPDDPVNHPAHYTKYPVECIALTQHMNFCVGNAVKYLYRAGDKDDYAQDLKKAAWYINKEIERVGHE